MTPSIEIRGLRKRFGAKLALADVDLSVAGAVLVGVIGPDGAGKTTLLRALAGLLEVEAQSARVLGFDLRGDVRALKARVGYVPQVFALQRELSVLENLRFTGRLHRIPAHVFERRTHDLLERTLLAEFADRPAGALSGGMKQKLAIANALLPEPALLILDECTAGVDVLARAEIFELLDERRTQTLTLLATSYLDEAERCDRLLHLDGGHVVASGTPEELRSHAGIELYRAWGPAPHAIARAARTLPFVTSARARGRSARIEVPNDRTPGEAEVLRALVERAGATLAERVAMDMESTLLALANRRAS